ncbi:anti-sigma factor family protein [Chitinophaga qingshengii]|uniref:Anti-sigma factor n=1 Tax=Chitinophaga qingshengii TaxID=1569794 RepID=A0ABR7TT50_9BACT|nr:hypothetical protein [Chitinophaga qingshengii]MBC9933638.1 hypothetical protein [Chitinophaga qingshengii]
MAVEINISNYESYLLSYVDNELNDAELAALEQFLQQHPPIRAELELLQGVRVVPDEQVVFDQKATLYRHTSAETMDYESMMLSYVDGELSAEDTVRLKSWLQQHPEAQKEMALLQVVKLEPDTAIVFKDKASLYRRSRKTIRMTPYWWGATAAAVLTGLIIWLLPAGKQHNSQPIAGTVTHEAMKPVTTPSAPVTAPVQAPAVTSEAPATPFVSAPEMAHAPGNRAAARKKDMTPVKRAPVTPTPQQLQNNNVVAAAPVPADVPVISTLPAPRNTSEEIVEKHQQNTAIAAAVPADNAPAAGHAKEPVMAANMPATVAKATSPVAAPAAVKGELILSVSGSDSRILDKVTNVAKFFSRKRNK